MYRYQGVRISHNGFPTYGDIYVTVYGRDLADNEIVTVGNDRVVILFRME